MKRSIARILVLVLIVSLMIPAAANATGPYKAELTLSGPDKDGNDKSVSSSASYLAGTMTLHDLVYEFGDLTVLARETYPGTGLSDEFAGFYDAVKDGSDEVWAAMVDETNITPAAIVPVIKDRSNTIADFVEVTKTLTATYTVNGNTYTVTLSFSIVGSSSGGSSDSTQKYSVTLGDTENGSAKLSASKAKKNDTVTITPTPDEGYQVASVIVTDEDGKIITVKDNKDGTYSFKMPGSKVNVKIVFELINPESGSGSTGPNSGISAWIITEDHIAYFSGYEDGTIGPDKSITRAEVATIFYRLLKYKDVAITVNFPDVPENAWYADAVNVLGSLGVVFGRDDGGFDGDAKITRAEFCAIIARFAIATDSETEYSDLSENHWAYSYIMTASAYGWVKGYPDGTFAPNKYITRAEVATIINRILGRAADEDYVSAYPDELKQFSDLQDTTKWYYLEMVEATNTHAYLKEDGVETWTKVIASTP